MLSGKLVADTRLPSTRDLAEQIGVSRSVVLEAYDQLLAEGFIVGRSGSGTYVARGLLSNRLVKPKKSADLHLSSFGIAAAEAAVALEASVLPSRCRYDFKFGRSESDIETFPFEQWQRMLTRRARRASVADLDYGPVAGNPVLRVAICAHLQRSRAVACHPSEVIIVNGSQQALDLIARVLLQRGDRVAMADNRTRATARRSRFSPRN